MASMDGDTVDVVLQSHSSIPGSHAMGDSLHRHF